MRPERPAEPRRPRAWLLTSYGTGAADGDNLGVPGYSYDLVARRFKPLLNGLGEVIPTRRSDSDLERAVRQARAAERDPVQVAFVAPQDLHFARSAPNVVVPAWEYPEVPDHPFDGNPQNDWVATCDRCELVVVGNEFTREALLRAGVQAPVEVVPVPVGDEYFDVGPWHPDQSVVIDRPARSFSQPDAGRPGEGPTAVAGGPSWKARARRAAGRALRTVLPRRVAETIAAAGRAALHEWREARHWDRVAAEEAADPGQAGIVSRLELSGVVYTTILNPADFRKNWDDLLTAFVTAFHDRPDVTLVVKLANRSPRWNFPVVNRYQHLGVSHRCRFVFITEYLSDRQMLDLCRATTYYLTTTRAEGNCLPVMDYLAAGRPAVSPCHTALGDYFGPDVGFVVESNPEPAAWPQDRRLRITTTWHRLVWPSLVAQLRASYELATGDRRGYEELARRGRERMRGWAGTAAVRERLAAALGRLDPHEPDSQAKGARHATVARDAVGVVQAVATGRGRLEGARLPRPGVDRRPAAAVSAALAPRPGVAPAGPEPALLRPPVDEPLPADRVHPPAGAGE